MVTGGLGLAEYRHLGATAGAYVGALLVGGYSVGWDAFGVVQALAVASLLVVVYLSVVSFGRRRRET
jgi:hypothetical protein